MSTNETQGPSNSSANAPVESGDFDFESMEDAGDSNLLTEAADEARRAAVNLSHRENEARLNYAEAYSQPSLYERTRMIMAADSGAFEFRHMSTTGRNADFSSKVTANSEMNHHSFFDCIFDNRSGSCPYPHKDEFIGKMVDHQGKPIEAKYTCRDMLKAIDKAGMDNPTTERMTNYLITWMDDDEHNRNSLCDYIDARMPKWDGKHRLEDTLIKLLKCHDTVPNRKIGKYFWLSLYARTYIPGSIAPISIALFGAQGAGKTRFSNELCRTIMGNESAAPVSLNFGAADYKPFLRAITGRSIIANAGEMIGFKTADMNRVKDFASSSSDEFDFKYSHTETKPRQWVIIMDGNKYDGLQRDETGNRRFYPFFLGQMPDKDGQPTWSKNFEVKYDGFADSIWQIMAECRDWIKEHGISGYNDYVGEASNVVRNFSEEERSSGRGVVTNEDLEVTIGGVLTGIPYDFLPKKSERFGISVDKAILRSALRDNGAKAYGQSMEIRMRHFGFESVHNSWVRYIERKPHDKDGISEEEDAQNLMFAARREIQRITLGSSAEEFDDDEIDARIESNVEGMAGYRRSVSRMKGPIKRESGF